jgi:ABC-type Na+ efflux pump permease subunit
MMDELGNFTSWQVFFIVIVPALITGIPVFISALAQRKSREKSMAEVKETEASAAEKLVGAYDKLAKDLQEQIKKLDERLVKAETDREIREKNWLIKQGELEIRLEKQGRKIRQLVRGARRLIIQIEELGSIPVFKFNEEDLNDCNDDD